ncbi:PRPF39 protein [Aphelenchoides avenae]|nr:PRPF39 protein [Aphelenchus avenae]
MGRNRSDSDSSGSPPPERHHRRNGSGRSRSRERSRRDSSSDSPNVLKEAWRVVKKDPEDFDAWTRLITLSETQDDERAIREVYEAFLRRYPYCYGYWRKFAEMERRHHHYDKCLDVYQRGVDAIPMVGSGRCHAYGQAKPLGVVPQHVHGNISLLTGN